MKIQDKDGLTRYRKLIEQRMEQFKDIERENKTKPHSKQGLSAEDKLDPREKDKADTIEWLQVGISRNPKDRLKYDHWMRSAIRPRRNWRRFPLPIKRNDVARVKKTARKARKRFEIAMPSNKVI